MLSLTQAPSGQNHAVFTDRGKSKASIIFLGSVAIIWIFFCIFYPQSYKAAKLLHVTLGTFPPGGSRGGLNPVFLRFLICLTLWALAVLFDSVFICWQIRKCFFEIFSGSDNCVRPLGLEGGGEGRGAGVDGVSAHIVLGDGPAGAIVAAQALPGLVGGSVWPRMGGVLAVR